MSLRVIIACGGTGGHLFPGLAVARALQKRGHKPLLIVSNKKVDQAALASAPDIPAKVVDSMGWPGVSLSAIKFGWLLVRSWFQLGSIFREFRPHKVIGMGGFTSAVPLERARWARLPTLLHDSNAMPGRVTRVFAPKVDRVLLGFRQAVDHLPKAEWAVTGTPLNPNVKPLDRVDAAARVGADPLKQTVLIVGGSQGARGVNDIFSKVAPLLSDEEIHQLQIIHLTGPADEVAVREAYTARGVDALVFGFNSDMGALYSCSDFVVARSGASTLTEIAAFGLPSLLIPYPFAADDHQTLNGRIFEKAGAARLIQQKDLTPAMAHGLIRDLLLHSNPEIERMIEAAKSLDVPDAAERVVQEIESCTQKN